MKYQKSKKGRDETFYLISLAYNIVLTNPRLIEKWPNTSWAEILVNKLGLNVQLVQQL